MRRSKRYKKLLEVKKTKELLNIKDLIPYVKKSSTAKFNESIDVSFKLNLKQKKTEVSLRTVVNFTTRYRKKKLKLRYYVKILN